MGIFDAFTKEFSASWEEEGVKKWKTSAVQILRTYYVGFKGAQFDEYRLPDDSKLLLFKICYSLYGGNIENENDITEENQKNEADLYSYYTKEQQQNGQEILDQILDVHKKNVTGDTLLVGIIMIACKQGDQEYVLPMFSIFAGENTEDAAAKRFYVDVHRRVYKSWDDWKANNTLPMLKYGYPKYGFFSCSGDCSYKFNASQEPDVEFANSPQCELSSRVLSTTDVVGVVTSLGCGAIFVASLFTPFGSGILLTSAITGGSFGVYGTARAIQRLFDKGTHKENLVDLESFTLYFSILATPLHFSASIVNAQLIKGATMNGTIFSNSTRMFATILNFSTLGVDSVLIGCGIANILEKYSRKELTTLDVVQFSMSVFYFTNTLIRPQTARSIIKSAQNEHIQKFASAMSDAEARSTFDRFVAENTGRGSILEKSKIIRTINRIENGDAVFGSLTQAKSIEIGGRKGKTILVDQKTRISLKDTEASASALKSIGKVLGKPKVTIKNEMSPNDVGVGSGGASFEEVTYKGKQLFKDLPSKQKTRVSAVFEEMGNNKLAIIQASFKLLKDFEQLTDINVTEKILCLIEGITREMRGQTEATFADIYSRMKEPNRFKKLKTSLYKYTNSISTNYHYQKATEEVVTVQPWNPSEEPVVVYLDNFNDDLFTEDIWTEINSISEIENEPVLLEKFSVVLSKVDNDSNACLITVKNGNCSKDQMVTKSYSADIKITLVNVINNDLLKFVSTFTDYLIDHQLRVQIVLSCGKRLFWEDLQLFLI